MKKIMGHVTVKLSLSILTVIILLVGVLAGFNKITRTTKAGSKISAANSIRSSQENLEAVRTAVRKMPLYFEPNRGQTDARVKFFARASGYQVFLTGPDSAVMNFWTSEKRRGADRLTQSLIGANASAASQPEAPTGGVSNYYIGKDRAKWIERIPNYNKIRYTDVYPGIDVVYQGDDLKLRYDFEVKPGADPKAIRMAYEGAKKLRVDLGGNLIASLKHGNLTTSKPYIFQDYGGKRHVVRGGFVLTANNDVRFEIGSYDAKQKLIIDPGLTYASYLGSSADKNGNFNAPTTGDTRINSIAMDGTGVYTAGWTNSPAFDAALLPGTQDVVVSKFSGSGGGALNLTSIVTTFFGGENDEQATGIALAPTTAASSGTALYVVGFTKSGIDFPTPGATRALPLVRTNEVNFNRHAFVVSMAKAGVSLSATSVLAGIGEESATAVAVDSTGKVHVVGNTLSPDLVGTPTPAGPNNLGAPPSTAAQPVFGSETHTNAFYVMMPAALSSVSYGTFLGGWNADTAAAVAVDSKGNAYITGTSTSWSAPPNNILKVFPVQPPQICAANSPIGSVCFPQNTPPQAPLNLKTFQSGTHAYVTAINPNSASSGAGTLLYSIPLGGDVNNNGQEEDHGTAIAVDLNFNVYVGGNTPNHTESTSQSSGNVVFTAPGIVTANGTAAGPGVLAAVNVVNGGNGYAANQVLVVSAPDAPGCAGANTSCTTAQAKVGTVNGSTVTSIIVTSQGVGYVKPPNVTGGNGSLIASAVVGQVILGKPTPNAGGCAATATTVCAQDGWVVELNTPGNTTTFTNGLLLSDVTPTGGTFPSFAFGTLVNGDETDGNGNGVVPPAGSVAQVTGVTTDAGASPLAAGNVGNGSAGPLANVYISGSSTNSTTGAGQAVEIRRRINENGISNAGNCCSTAVVSPFLNTFSSQSNAVTPLGDINLTAVGAPIVTPAGGLNLANIPGATGVAYDTSSGRSCVGGWVTGGVVTDNNTAAGTIFGGPPKSAVTAYPVGPTSDGFVACAPFLNDVTISSGAGANIFMTMQAGVTQQIAPPGATRFDGQPFVALGTGGSANQLVSVTNPNSVSLPVVFVTNDPRDSVFYTPGGGPAGGPNYAQTPDPFLGDHRWLFPSLAPGGQGVVLSLINPTAPTAPVPASSLDPGYYQATVIVFPCFGPGNPTAQCTASSGDNGGIPILITVNLVVTGDLVTNTGFAGGVASSLTATIIPGQGFADVGANNEIIDIPVFSSVPLNSISDADIVFDLKRDVNGNPIFINSSTAFPVLGVVSQNGNVNAINLVAGTGTGYASNQSGQITLTAPACSTQNPPPPAAVCRTATATFQADVNGVIQQANIVITDGGAGYSNPPFVTFPLPGVGGVQAQATAVLGGFVGQLNAGGVIDLRPIRPDGLGCGQTPFINQVPQPKTLAHAHACYIRVILPPNMLFGATGATSFKGTFILDIPSGTLNVPSNAPETQPPSPSPIITFTPQTITITVNIQNGGLLLTSPWVSNNAPFIINPPLSSFLPGTAGNGISICEGAPVNPLTGNNCDPNRGPCNPGRCVAPFSVPDGFTGTQDSSNNGEPFVFGFTGNNVQFSNLGLDSRNLGTTASSPLTNARIAFDSKMELAFTENHLLAPANGALPIPTCTVKSPSLPNDYLETVFPTTVPASNAVATVTALTIRIKNPSGPSTQFPNGLPNGYYTFAYRFTAVNGSGQNVFVDLPGCLSVGNHLRYDYLDDGQQFPQNGFQNANFGNDIVSGPPLSGLLFLEAGASDALTMSLTALGPSQIPQIPNPGGPQFAPPDNQLELPTVIPIPLGVTCEATIAAGNCNPTWIFKPTIPAGADIAFGTNCNGTRPASSCTPILQNVFVAPAQNTGAGAYEGGFHVTQPADAVGVQKAQPTPLDALLPVTVSSGPSLQYIPLTEDPNSCGPNGNQPCVSANGGGNVIVIVNNGGSGYDAAHPPAVHFLGGGCTTPPVATAVVINGAVDHIAINNPGAGCTSAPQVDIDPPTTPGGQKAFAFAQVSQGTVTVNFTQLTGATATTPAAQIVGVLPSREGISLDLNNITVTLFAGNAPGNAIWLLPANVVPNGNCQPITHNPAQAEPGLFNGCELTITPNFAAQFLPQGSYQAVVLVPVLNNAAQPALETILVNLNVVAGPSVVAPSTLTFTVDQCTAPVSVPATQIISLSTNIPLPTGTTSVAFTATAISNGNFVLLNGAAGTPVQGTLTCTPGTTTCTVSPALTLSIDTSKTSGVGQTFSGTVQFNFPAVPGGLVVANPTFSVGVNATVQNCPTLNFTPAGPAHSDFTVGQTASVPASFNTTLNIAGNDSATVTSTCGGNTPCPWITLNGGASVNTSSTSTPIAVAIVAANLPTSTGDKTATITATGTNSGQTATYTVTVTVAPKPNLTLTSGGANSANITYNTGDPDPAPIVLAVALDHTSPANPSVTVNVAVTSTPAGWCDANPKTLTINNTPGSITVTFTPLEAHLPATPAGQPDQCIVTLSSPQATRPAGASAPEAIAAATAAETFTINLTVNAVSLLNGNPTSLTVNAPLGATTPFTQTVTLTGVGTFPFLATVQQSAACSWLTATAGNVSAGIGLSTVTVTVGALGVGTYTCAVAYSGDNNLFNFPVTLNVGTVTPTPTSLAFPDHTIGVTVPAAKTVSISTLPAVSLPFTATITGADAGVFSFSTPPPASTTAGSATLSVTYTAPTTPRTYNANLHIALTGSPTAVDVPITLIVRAQPVLSATFGTTAANQTPVVNNTFNLPPVSIGQANPSTLLTIFAKDLSFTPAPSTIPFSLTFSSVGSWLNVAPTSGTVGNAGTALTVSATLAALPVCGTAPNSGPCPGTYDGTITVTAANAANSPQVYTVVLNVFPTPAVSFTPPAGTCPGNACTSNWTIGQTSASPNSFTDNLTLVGLDTVGITTTCGGVTPCPWLTAAPASVSNPGISVSPVVTSILATINVAGFTNPAPGTRTATVTAHGTAGEADATFTVAVTIAAAPTITLTPAGPLTFSYIGGGQPGNPVPVIGTNGAVAISLTNTPQNPSIPLVATNSNPTVCTITQPGSVNNSGGSMNVTINQPAIQAVGTYTCDIAVASNPTSMTANTAHLVITINTVNPTLTSATPNPIVVDAPAGGTPINVTVNLVGTGTFPFLANAVSLTPVGGPSWLTATGGTITNGAGSSTVTFTIGTLQPGQYVGSVAFSGPGNQTLALLNVPVILNVGAITADQTSIAFNHTLNFTPPAQQSTTVHLTALTIPTTADSLGKTGLAFTAVATTVTGGNWLTVQPTSGSVNSAPTTLTVAYTIPTTCTPTTATPCSFTGDVAITTLNSSAAVIHIPVTLTVFITPTLSASVGGLNATSVLFPATVIGNQPAPITVSVIGNGLPAGQTMPFSLTFTSAPNWLVVAPTSGNTGAAGSPISVSVNLAAFGPNPLPGTYDGTIVITSPNSSNVLTLGVVLTLVPPIYTVSPLGLITFTTQLGVPGITPPSQLLTFSSNGATLPITVASTQPSWLNVTVSGQTATLTPSLTGITGPGTYTATVLFFIAGASNQTLPVTVNFVVLPQGSCTLALSPNASLSDTGTTTGGFIPLNSQTFTITPTPNPAGSSACAGASWTVTSSTPGTAANWLAVTGGASGSGANPATVTFTAMGNPHSSARSATLTVTASGTGVTGGVFTVTEAGDAGTFNQRAIRAFYQQLLGRDPDQGGFNFWNGQCSTSAACLGQLVDQFMESPEGQSTDMATMIAYQGATGAAPTFTQWAASVAQLRSGAQTPTGLLTVLNPNLTTAQLYQNLLGRAPNATEATQSVAAAYTAIVNSAEFKNTTSPAGTDHTNFLWVRLVYYVTLDRDPDTGGLQFWVNQAGTTYGPGIFYGSSTAAQNARIAILGPGTPFQGFVGSPEFQNLFN